MKPRSVNILVAITIVATLTLMFAATIDVHNDAPKSPPTLNEIQLQIDPATAVRMFDDLPDSAFKSNLLIVMGAHLNGDDEELNRALTAFAEYKLKQIENK